MSNVFDFPNSLKLKPVDRRARELAHLERLDRLYGQWQMSHGTSNAPEPDATIEDELAAHAHRAELVLLLAGLPAPRPSLIARKLEMLERLLENRPCEAGAERSEFVIIAGIRADLVALTAS